jgi:hypothetical protein
MIPKLAVFSVSMSAVLISGTGTDFDFQLFSSQELDEIEKEFGSPVVVTTAVPDPLFIREKLAMMDFLKASPGADGILLLAYVKTVVPDSVVGLEYVKSQKAKILSPSTVPGWLHEALVGLKDQIMSPGIVPDTIYAQVAAQAPDGSVVGEKPQLLKRMVFAWIMFCLKPTWLNPNHPGEPFCARFVGGNGEYSVFHRLSRGQLSLFLDTYSRALLRQSV